MTFTLTSLRLLSLFCLGCLPCILVPQAAAAHVPLTWRPFTGNPTYADGWRLWCVASAQKSQSPHQLVEYRCRPDDFRDKAERLVAVWNAQGLPSKNLEIGAYTAALLRQ